MRFAGLAVAAFLLSGCATPRVSAPLRPSHAGFQPRATPRPEVVLREYRRERGCKGPAYAAVQRYAAQWLDTVVSVPTDASRVTEAIRNGRFRIQFAEAAARKRCLDVARDVYLEVNGIFTGDPYSSLRQRAGLGLSKLGPRPARSDDPQH
jgi:predicted Zn-dependent protease